MSGLQKNRHSLPGIFIIIQTVRRLLGEHPKITIFLSISLSIVGLAVLFSKSFFLQKDTVDFKYIWLAGQLWNESVNPYSQIFRDIGEEMFKGYNRPLYWLYPPHMWVFSRPFALLEYETAMTWWRILSGGLALAGIYYLAIALIKAGIKLSFMRFSMLLFFVGAMSATSICISLGQTSIISFFAISVFIYAFLAQNKVAMIFSIFLLMLKPQIGIIFCFFLLPNRFWFGTLLVSTIAVVLLSLQPLFIDDPLVTIGNYLEVLRVYYPKITSNEAINMTGLRHFIYLVVGVSLPPIIFLLTAILGAVSLGFCWRRRAKEPLDENQYQLLIGVLLILFILVPMHIYDSIIIAPLIVLIVKRSVIVQAATALFLLMVFRSNNLASLTGFYSDENKHSIGSSIEVVSGMLLIGFFLWIYLRRFREMLPDKLKK